MTDAARARLEAEAAELYPMPQDRSRQQYATIQSLRFDAHVRAKTVSAEQVEAAAEDLCKARYQIHGVKLEHAKRSGNMWRKDIEFLTPQVITVFRAAGFYVEGDDDE